MEYVLNYDWLQFSMLIDIYKEPHSFKSEVNCLRSNVFNKIVKFSYENYPFATLFFEPFSKALNPSLALVKIENQWCYYKNLWLILGKFLAEISAKQVKVSRLDLSVDFQNLKDFENPEDVIHFFLSEKILKIGSSKFTCIGDKKFRNEMSYLRFGQRSSVVCAYLYNKSKELREVADKPYIREIWYMAGFDEMRDTWRLEFSLTPTNDSATHPDFPDFHRITPIFLFKKNSATEIADALVSKYWRFVWNDGQIRKDRMKPVKFFEIPKGRLTIVRLKKIPDVKTSVKRFLSQALNHSNVMKSIEMPYSDDFDTALTQYSYELNLKNYLDYKKSLNVK